MARLGILFVLLAAPAVGQAQETPTASGPTASGPTASAPGGGLVTGAALGPLAPIGIAGGTYGAARLLDLNVSGADLFIQTSVGTIVGVGVAVGTYWVVTEVDAQAESLGLALTSLAAGVGTAAITTALRVDAQPAVLRVPTGEGVPGLSLRLAL